LKKATRVIVVVDEARERLVRAGLPGEKITVVENTEDESYFSALPLDQELIAQFQTDFVIAYVGGIEGPHRGLLTAVEAMPTILTSIPNARLLIVGAGRLKPALEAVIAKLHLSLRVTLTGYQPFQKVPTYIALSAVCLVPYLANPHTEATIPHKLFQYMLMGKPVVVSSCRPLQRIVEATGSGLVFQAGDSTSLANAVIRLKDPNLRQKLGAAGRQASMGHYSWRETAHKLTALYEQLD
jgi:glycosyltransferase involved in cell wall biosynthesis